MIVDKAVYRGGCRSSCGDLSNELESLRTAPRSDGRPTATDEDGPTAVSNDFIWIGLKDPTDAEFALVNDELRLHPLAVEDAVHGNQRPKIEHYEGNLLVVLKTLRYIEASSDVETGEVMVFVGDRFVVTVRRGEANQLAKVRADLESCPEQLVLGPSAVLHAVMDSVVDNYIVVDEALSIDLERIEAQVFSGSRDVDATSIYRLRREVLEFRRAAVPLSESIRRLHFHPHSNLVDRNVLPFFRDVEDHLLRVIDHVESYDRLLGDILSAHLAQISVQQNDDMRKISAWVAIAALPTMIAGIYGMNFHSIPELEASVQIGGSELYYGYFVVLLVMAALCLALYRGFKRSGWL